MKRPLHQMFEAPTRTYGKSTRPSPIYTFPNYQALKSLVHPRLMSVRSAVPAPVARSQNLNLPP